MNPENDSRSDALRKKKRKREKCVDGCNDKQVAIYISIQVINKRWRSFLFLLERCRCWFPFQSERERETDRQMSFFSLENKHKEKKKKKEKVSLLSSFFFSFLRRVFFSSSRSICLCYLFIIWSVGIVSSCALSFWLNHHDHGEENSLLVSLFVCRLLIEKTNGGVCVHWKTMRMIIYYIITRHRRVKARAHTHTQERKENKREKSRQESDRQTRSYSVEEKNSNVVDANNK